MGGSRPLSATALVVIDPAIPAEIAKRNKLRMGQFQEMTAEEYDESRPTSVETAVRGKQYTAYSLIFISRTIGQREERI